MDTMYRKSNMLVLLLTYVLIVGASSQSVPSPPFVVANVCDKDYGKTLQNVTSPSLVACCLECVLLAECQTAILDNATHICRLNAGKLSSPTDDGCDNTVRYAEFQTGTNSVGCVGDDDCPGGDAFVCNDEGQCVCAWGFSHNTRNDTCVAGCIRYGSSFEVFDGIRLTKNNDIKLDNVTFDEAKELCVRETTLECISIDCYKPSTICWLSKESFFTQPWSFDNTIAAVDYVYFQRECA